MTINASVFKKKMNATNLERKKEKAKRKKEEVPRRNEESTVEMSVVKNTVGKLKENVISR